MTRTRNPSPKLGLCSERKPGDPSSEQGQHTGLAATEIPAPSIPTSRVKFYMAAGAILGEFVANAASSTTASFQRQCLGYCPLSGRPPELDRFPTKRFNVYFPKHSASKETRSQKLPAVAPDQADVSVCKLAGILHHGGPISKNFCRNRRCSTMQREVQSDQPHPSTLHSWPFVVKAIPLHAN